MLASLRHLQSLTPAQRALLRAKRVEGEYTIEALIDQLTPLAEFDALGDHGRTAWGRVAGSALLVAVLAGLIAFALPFTLLICVPAAIVAVIAFVKRKKLAQFDAANSLREVALPFLRMIALDMPPDGRLQVRIDFSDTVSAKNQLGKVDTQKAHGTTVRTTRYRNDWFAGSTRLADGSQLRWQVDEALSVRERQRRNPRGKIKSKTKRTQRNRLRVLLSLSRRRYAAVNPADRSLALDARHIKVQLGQKLKAERPGPIAVDTLVHLVAAAYAKVRPLSKEARA